MEAMKPEAAYFVADDGKRTAYFYPAVAEPFFMNLKAQIDCTPASSRLRA